MKVEALNRIDQNETKTLNIKTFTSTLISVGELFSYY